MFAVCVVAGVVAGVVAVVAVGVVGAGVVAVVFAVCVVAVCIIAGIVAAVCGVVAHSSVQIDVAFEREVHAHVRANVVVVAFGDRQVVFVVVGPADTIGLVRRLVGTVDASADRDWARFNRRVERHAVVVVVCVVIGIDGDDRAGREIAGRHVDASDRPTGLAVGNSDHVCAAQKAVEHIGPVIGGRRRVDRLGGSGAEELDGDPVDARFALVGDAVSVKVEPDQVAESVHNVGLPALVGDREAGAHGVPNVDRLELGAEEPVSCREDCVIDDVRIRPPLVGRCHLWRNRIVDRTGRGGCGRSDDAVVDRRLDWRCAGPPLEAL